MALGGRGRGSARAVVASVREQLARGWPPGLTVLTGSDLYHLDLAQCALLEALAPAGASELTLTVLGGDRQVDIGTAVAAARSAGMFSARRVVLVREVATLAGDPQALETYAGKPPRDSFLIVRAPQLDRRFKLHQALARAGRLVEFQAGEPHETLGDLLALAHERGLELERTAAGLLNEICAGDFYRVESELAKLQLSLGEKRRRVGVDDVRAIVAGSGLLSSWEIGNAVGARDRGAALAALRRIVMEGEEPLKLLGGLAYRARVMLAARASIERGLGTEQVLRAAKAWNWRDALASSLKRYSLAEVLAFPAALAEADRTLKSRSIPPLSVLETLVERLIGQDPTRAAGGP